VNGSHHLQTRLPAIRAPWRIRDFPNFADTPKAQVSLYSLPPQTGSLDRLTELRILSAALAHTARNVEDRSERQTRFRGYFAATHAFS